MKISVCLPYMKEGITRKDFLDWFRVLDQGPFESLSCGERITGYSYEMRTILSAAAAVTERIRIVPSLYVLPMHDAVWAAKEIATLDMISEGRVTVTVGVGGREMDYQAVNANFNNRFKRMDEQVATMKRIWAQEPPFEGADPVGPRPFQDGGPPIIAGSMGPKSIARVSHWADGLYGFAMNGEESLIKYFFDTAKQEWQNAGRDTPPKLIGGFWYSLADNSEASLKQYTYDYLKIMDEETAKNVAAGMRLHDEGAILEAINAIEELGTEELFMVPATADVNEVHRLAELLSKR